MFKGVFTALVTPFNQDGSIDKAALEALLDFQLENNINGLVPMGTTCSGSFMEIFRTAKS